MTFIFISLIAASIEAVLALLSRNISNVFWVHVSASAFAFCWFIAEVQLFKSCGG